MLEVIEELRALERRTRPSGADERAAHEDRIEALYQQVEAFDHPDKWEILHRDLSDEEAAPIRESLEIASRLFEGALPAPLVLCDLEEVSLAG